MMLSPKNKMLPDCLALGALSHVYFFNTMNFIVCKSPLNKKGHVPSGLCIESCPHSQGLLAGPQSNLQNH